MTLKLPEGLYETPGMKIFLLIDGEQIVVLKGFLNELFDDDKLTRIEVLLDRSNLEERLDNRIKAMQKRIRKLEPARK